MKSLAQKRFAIISLITITVAQPLMSFARNPDILHDAYFFSQGKALNAGLRIHEDVYSPYGSLVPWIFSFCMRYFGDYLIIGRILGLFILLAICLIMYSILRHKISVLNSLLCVSLFVSLSPERTEVSSPRWIYGAGIWPTSIVVLLTLNLLWISVKVFSDQKSKLTSLQLLLASPFSALLLVSRIQGILTYLLFVIALCLCLISDNREVRRRSTIVLIGISISTVLLLMRMVQLDLLASTIFEMIVAPFNVTGYGMNGRWISWMSSFVISCTASILAFCFFVKILMVSMKRIGPHYILVLYSPILLTVFFVSSTYEFPQVFNGNPILWSMKVVTWLPSWTTWVSAISCLYVICLALLRKMKHSSLFSERFVFSRSVNSLMMPIGIASFSNLFYNYGYIYILFPVTLIVFVFNIERISFSELAHKGVKLWATMQVIIFTSVSICGYLQESRSFTYEMFDGMRDSREYSMQMQEVVIFVDSANIHNTSQFLCDHSIYRIFDVASYQIDKTFMISPPQDRASYLSRISKSADEVLICGKDNFFSGPELFDSGWQELKRLEVEKESSLSVQLLTRSGGG